MKIRLGHVTNSSSSSFVISSKDITLEELFNGAFKEFYFEVNKNWYDEEELDFWKKEFDLTKIVNDKFGNCLLLIKSGKEVNEDNWDRNDFNEEEEFYVIDNNDNIRFDWDLVEDIFDKKYKIPYKYGYCD